jgi:prophage regulatory protein
MFNQTWMEPMKSEDMQARTPFVRLNEVKARTGLSRSTLYAYVRDGGFPAPVAISKRCVAWVEGEIDQWIADRIAARVHGVRLNACS